ncbi:FUSC family protein [Pseudomonas peli]|uniref:FUSC family protein n=1 Tax=Pseudomonas peli TaxID=592361 RepID=UPI003D15B98A
MLLTCVVCGLFASRENGAQIGMSFMRGIFLAVPAAFSWGRSCCPSGAGFPMLAMGMGVPLFFGALGMAKPQIGATPPSFCLHFIVLISPMNRMTFDVASLHQ